VNKAWIALPLAILGLLWAAPAFGSTGKQSYEGAAATEGVNGRDPTVRLKVQFKKVHHRRGKPSQLVQFAERAIALRCPDGSKTFGGPTLGELGGPGGYDELGDTGQRVNKKGNFHASGPSADESDTQTVTGHVSKKGNATGTIRVVATTFSGMTCDSGVVSWTASPVSAFGPVVQPPCVWPGTCPLSARGR
jgi:hypothetical protein